MASCWSDTLVFPLYVGAASLAIFSLHFVSEPVLKWRGKTRPIDSIRVRQLETHHSLAARIEERGGKRAVAFNAARLAGCLALLTFSIFSLISNSSGDPDGEETEERMIWNNSPQEALCATYFYGSLLAILSIAGSVRWSKVATRHLNTLLFFTFSVYLYRDLFPLATFPLVPMDLAEGSLLWVKVTVLFTVSVIIPLATPRQYTPLDPKNPMPEPNPEQTASILSSMLYSFLDPIVFLAYRIPHLAFDQLSPLSDYDYAENLKKRAFPHLNTITGERRHLLLGLLWIYRWSLVKMGVLLVVIAVSAFISPIGLNKLLYYLENPSEESFMKPWFWILLFLVGPLVRSLSQQSLHFILTRMMTQTSAIITQLVFEHALRIRVKAETKTENKTAPQKTNANLQGKISNLVTVDLGNISAGSNAVLLLLVPIQVVLSVIFLYQVLGWSAFVGMGVMVALFPLPGYAAKWQQTVQREMLKKTDARVQAVSESKLTLLRMFGWENLMNKKIGAIREEELKWIWKRKLLEALDGFLNIGIPLGTMLATYADLIQAVLAREDLSASIVFSSMTVFDILRNQLQATFYYISTGVSAQVSFERLNDFLHNTELLDSFVSNDAEHEHNLVVVDDPALDVIGFRNTTFAWSNDEPSGARTPSSRKFLLKVQGEVHFKAGCINLVVGPTGSGKTSLLMALLGEMHHVPSSPSSWFNLPRDKGVSYAAQESWVMNDTIKNNILFNAPMDTERYKKVLHQCCLERDLELFDAHDETEVGEKGLTLSGGQKARVTLARAIYSNTEIILLDDVLAALDVHTAKWIVDKCLRGDLIVNRTVILVTHNVAMAGKIADHVVSVDLNGHVRSQGSISDALEKDKVLAEEVGKDKEILEAAEKEIDAPPPGGEPKKTDGKLIVAEEIAVGHVSWSALSLYFESMGGRNSPLFFPIVISLILATEGVPIFRTWYLGYWASLYGHGVPVAVWHMVIFVISLAFYTLGSLRASRAIHRQLVESILGTTLRCTADISALDVSIADTLWYLLDGTARMVIQFFAVVLFAPIFFFAGALVGIIGAALGKIYVASQLSVKREASNTRAPVLGHFGATMAGLTSVRAYGAQEAVIQISLDRINRSTRAARTLENLNRWVTVRIDLLGALFAASLAYYVVYFQSQQPFNIGFSLAQAIGFSGSLLYWVRLFNHRIQAYTAIEQEPKPTTAGIPPAYWPASGNLSVDRLSAKYSPEGPNVLHDISFNIKSGERVGVVGRTGSGKSSLTLSLLRCIFTDGTVYYDGIPTSSLNLDAIRSNITIIPQVPELLAGSLRSNLDMFDQFDDAILNNALQAAGLSSLQEGMDEGKLTLDTEISATGGNLSVGQRQIIALARAIVRGSKLLILDEDYKTDTVIQTSLRTELSSDTTILTVAHRLQTIMDADKIMVLDAGRIVEFDHPKVLLQNKHGLLRALVDESEDKGALYEKAGA
ncbi:P-loop containing nucleoside triphosphate hydrolase protein [Mycena crocata]|nr:P-loop containing nucleoside triphosphate hydrolase protein [Mycena crocata]